MNDKYWAILLFVLIGLHGKSFGSVNPHKGKEIGKFYITVHYLEAVPNDTVQLTLLNVFKYPLIKGVFKSGISNSRFLFEIPVNQSCGFFKLTTERHVTKGGGSNENMSLIYDQVWEVGDSVTIELSHQETGAGILSKCRFLGLGIEKYKAKYEIDNFERDHPEVQESGFKSDLTITQSRRRNPLVTQKLELLKAYEPGISAWAIAALRAQVLFSFRTYQFYFIKKYYLDNLKADPTRTQAFLKKYQQLYCGIDDEGMDHDLLADSWDYLDYKIRSLTTQSVLQYGKYLPDSVYKEISNLTVGKLRENLILFFFLKERNSPKMTQMATDAEKKMKSSFALETLSGIKNHLRWQIIKDYRFTDPSGKYVKLSDFAGKVLLLDIWFEGCGGCARYFREALSVVENEFRNNSDVVFLSISVDKSKVRWLKGVSSGLYTSSHAVNVYSNGLGGRHSIMTDNNILVVPTAILINKKGRIEEFNSTTLYDRTTLRSVINKALRAP